MENQHCNAVYPQLAAVDSNIIGLELERQEKPACDGENSVRKSVRCKRPPQSFSPTLEGAVGDRNESSKTKKQRTKSATAPDRPCDLMPNGDPFLCVEEMISFDFCCDPFLM
ncbi:uncharacterized protein [Argopecten irradians]|uniref:uncharacterized protein n=1 Tax=Argopecten irradians TaxID=31199 RepID=UPI00371384ED